MNRSDRGELNLYGGKDLKSPFQEMRRLSADMHRGQRASLGNQTDHAIKAGYKSAAGFFATQHKFLLLPGRHPYKSTMIAEQEQLARRAAVQNALASQRMEGLEPEPQVLEDAQKWARGEKTITQAIADFKARLQRASA